MVDQSSRSNLTYSYLRIKKAEAHGLGFSRLPMNYSPT